MATVDVPADFDRTGCIDLYDKFAAFLARVPDGSTIVFPECATFRLDGSTTVRAEGGLILNGRRGLRIDGNGTTLTVGTTGTRNRSNVLIRMCHDIQIDGLNVVGANPASDFLSNGAYVAELEGQHGFSIESSYGILLSDCSAERTYGDLIYVGKYTGKGAGQWSECVIIDGGLWQYAGRQGMTVTAGRKIWFQDATLREVRRSTFDFEPTTAGAGVDGITLERVRVGRGRLSLIAACSSYRVDNVKMIDCDIYGRPLGFVVEAWGYTKPKTGTIATDADRWTGWEISGTRGGGLDYNGKGCSGTFKGLADLAYRDNRAEFRLEPNSTGGRAVMVGMIGTDIGTYDVCGNQFLGGKGQAIVNGQLIPF